MNASEKRITYYAAERFMASIHESIDKSAEVVLDIGCGIVPMSYFRPKLHFMLEPWREYADILSFRHRDDKSIIILRQSALQGLSMFADQTVDSIFLLDVIEHMEKNTGIAVLSECERVARGQIVVFTPLGFMPQHVDSSGEKDAWGLNGAQMQEHRSGWLPNDFTSEYEFHICMDFHKENFRNQVLPKPFGAFFAIRNSPPRERGMPQMMSDIRRPLPSELKLQECTDECARWKLAYDQAIAELNRLRETGTKSN